MIFFSGILLIVDFKDHPYYNKKSMKFAVISDTIAFTIAITNFFARFVAEQEDENSIKLIFIELLLVCLCTKLVLTSFDKNLNSSIFEKNLEDLSKVDIHKKIMYISSIFDKFTLKPD